MTESHPPGRPGNAMVKHENRDVDVRVISVLALGLLASVLVVIGIVRIVYRSFASAEARAFAPPPGLLQSNRQPPEPRLQADPAKDLQEMRAIEDEILNSYGWVDTNADIVRIPIDRAMQLLVEKKPAPSNQK